MVDGVMVLWKCGLSVSSSWDSNLRLINYVVFKTKFQITDSGSCNSIWTITNVFFCFALNTGQGNQYL